MHNNGPFFTTESWGCVEAKNPYGELSHAATKKTGEVPVPQQILPSRIISQSDEAEENFQEDSTSALPAGDALSQEREEPGVLQKTLVIENAEFGIGIHPLRQG